jgi:PAS domain S-box-containing protein
MFYESQSLFVEHEVEWKKKNGDIITILLGLVPLFPEEKNSELVFTFIDITEEKKAKDALIASENKLNTMFKVLPVGVGIIQDRVITVTNNEAEVITGYTKEEIIGQNVRILYKNEKQFLEAGKQLYQNNFKGGVELNWLKKDGKEEIFVYMNIMPLSNDIVHGEMLFSFIDITSLKNAEKEIRILNEELEERVKKRTAQLEAANRELEAFSYSVSHDLRAPLRSIDGFSLALFEDYSDVLDDEGKTFILRVRSGAQRMSRLIDDMLKLSRTTRGELKITKFKIDELVNSIINTIKDSNIGTKAEFVVSADIEVFADITLLRSVLENLLGNAFKFTSKIKMPQIAFGYFSKEIAFDKFNINRDVFFVKDNGAGFDMEYVDKIFGAFQRLHKEAEFEGTGIGLASVQRIINRHGGKIWAEGEVNKGATFYFTLN